MDFAARTIPPSELCDRYIALGGGTSRPAVQGLWDEFGERTATLMGAGANFLAATWEASLAVSAAKLPAAQPFGEPALAAIYQDEAFVPSYTLDQIGPHLSVPGPSSDAPPNAQERERAALSTRPSHKARKTKAG